jgi:hypothetical protein
MLVAHAWCVAPIGASMNRRILFLVSLLAVGCAGARPATSTSGAGEAADRAALTKSAPGTRVICKYEKPTGSNIPERTCYRVLDDLQRDHSRDMTIDELNKPQAQMKAGN